jgi:hypothetical protein
MIMVEMNNKFQWFGIFSDDSNDSKSRWLLEHIDTGEIVVNIIKHNDAEYDVHCVGVDHNVMRCFTSLHQAQQYAMYHATHRTQLYQSSNALVEVLKTEHEKFDKELTRIRIFLQQKFGEEFTESSLSKEEVERLLSAMSVFPETDAVQDVPDEI